MKENFYLKLLTVSAILLSACTTTIVNSTGSTTPTTTTGTTTSTDTLNNGLVLYLPFEGDANDSSVNKNNGTVFGKVTFTAGKVGKAALFNGTPEDADTYILVKNSDKLSLKSTFTISAWTNSTAMDAGAFYPIVTKGKETEDYTMWLTPGGTDILLNWQTDHELWPHLEQQSNEKITANKWIHSVVTYDGSKVISYSDGIMTKSSDYNKPVDSSSEDLYIGASFPGSLEVFKGMIDEVRIYDRVLTSSEINTLATQK